MAYIYKIFCKDFNVKECYYGSTKNFKRRKWGHKSNCNNENSPVYNSPVYKFIRCNGGWQNWSIHVIDCITSKDKEIYEKCERKYIRDNKEIALNFIIPGRTKKEYCQDNKEKISDYKKEWYQDNIEKISKKVPCDICNKILNKSSLSRHKKTNKKCLTLALNLHQ